jgi:hypothetical protein
MTRHGDIRQHRAVRTMALLIMLLTGMAPALALAYEREVALGEEAAEKMEAKKEGFKFWDRFRLELGVGWGQDYNQTAIVAGYYQLTPSYANYLSRLGLEYSKSEISLSVSAAFALHPRFGVYVGAPFAMVQKQKDNPTDPFSVFEEEKYDFGVGDIYGGVYGQLLTEGTWWPSITLSVDANSDLAKFSSLGDGVWDFTPGLRLQKTIYKPVYLFGLGDYTYKLKKSGVKPGDVIGYGGGLGWDFGQGTTFEVGLKGYTIDESKIDGVLALESTHDLVLTVGIRSFKGLSFIFNMGNLDKKIDWKSNYTGFMISYAF